MIEHQPGEIYVDDEGGKHVCIETDSSAWMSCEYNCSVCDLCVDSLRYYCSGWNREGNIGVHYERVEE